MANKSQEKKKKALIGTLEADMNGIKWIARTAEAVILSGVDQYAFADALKNVPADKVEKLAWSVGELYDDDPAMAAEVVRLIPDILERSNGNVETVWDLSTVIQEGGWWLGERHYTDMYYAMHDLDSREAAEIVVGLCNLGGEDKSVYLGGQAKLLDFANMYRDAYMRGGKAEAFVKNLRAALAAETPSKDAINEAYAMTMATEPVKKWAPTDDKEKEKPAKNKNGEER